MADMLDNGESLLDVRDLIERYEELESDKGGAADAEDEFKTLQEVLDGLAGAGGDHEWRGVWYPVTLIRESYFVEDTQSFAEEIGAVDGKNSSWIAIDWEKTAENRKIDFSEVEIDGVTYLYR